jgi:NADP-dependent 3-hydroxy acid dehydrogenase YdfG
MQTRLDGYVTVITGASSGIGQATVRRFAQAGSKVVAAARRRNRLDQVVEAVRKEGGEALAVPTDVAHYSQVKALVERTLDTYGQIDVMINNAGHALEKPVVDSTVEELDAQIDSNLRGVMYGCRAVLPHMISRREGQIINIGSVCSVRYYPNYAAYVAAKFGVLGFTHSLYEEVREYGIRMNVIAPGAVNTAWGDIAGADLPWAREDRLQPEDIAELAFFCVVLPRRVRVENIVVWPMCESTT